MVYNNLVISDNRHFTVKLQEMPSQLNLKNLQNYITRYCILYLKNEHTPIFFALFL